MNLNSNDEKKYEDQVIYKVTLLLHNNLLNLY